MNIPVYLAIRRTLVFFILMLNCLLGRKKDINKVMTIAITLITSGAIIAAYGNFDNNFTGYFYVIIHNCLTAAMLEYSKLLSSNKQTGILDIIFNNALNSLPIIFIFFLFSDSIGDVINYSTIHMNQFYLSLLLLMILCFCHQFMMFYCTREISAFAIAFTHNFKDIISTTAGIFIFQDIEVNMNLILGLFVSFSGAFLITYNKVVEDPHAADINKPEIQYQNLNKQAKPFEKKQVNQKSHEV